MIAIAGPVVEEVEGMTAVEEVEGTIVISGPASLVAEVISGPASLKTTRAVRDRETGSAWSVAQTFSPVRTRATVASPPNQATFGPQPVVVCVSVREVVVDGVAKTSRGEEEEGGERWLPGHGHQRTPRK